MAVKKSFSDLMDELDQSVKVLEESDLDIEVRRTDLFVCFLGVFLYLKNKGITINLVALLIYQIYTT